MVGTGEHDPKTIFDWSVGNPETVSGKDDATQRNDGNANVHPTSVSGVVLRTLATIFRR
jgi:hypothetical protein